MGNGELLGEYTFTLWEALLLFPESSVVDDTIYLIQERIMNLDFLFEIWINQCIESFLYADSAERAREYFEDGMEVWEFENECERQWLATQNYY